MPVVAGLDVAPSDPAQSQGLRGDRRGFSLISDRHGP
jgi:hypothetical protein